MGRDIDEAWIEEAIQRYRRIEERTAEFERAAKVVTVTVHSPDGLVGVVVAADGTIQDVQITGSLQGRTSAQLSRSVREAVTAAADAAAWARKKLHAETFGEYPPLLRG
jgi:DNA-binding protein YbaB